MKKKIIVFLTNDDLYGFIDRQDELPIIAYTLEAFQSKIAAEESVVLTTLTDAIDSKYYKLGYDIIIVSEGKNLRFSDLLKYGYSGREIRLEHDWRKMVVNDVFAPKIRANWSFYCPIPGIVIKK